MGTHPIFESDFDCLTEKLKKMSGKLYTYPDNVRADKIRAVAAISGYKLDIAAEYTHGVTNQTPEFQAKFFGKVPAFESGDVALCDDTAIAHFVGNDQTRGGSKGADVLCWAGFAENTLLPAVAQWVWPALSIVQPNKAHMNDAKATLKKAMGFLNSVLSAQTFLVGERVTYADISVGLTRRNTTKSPASPTRRRPPRSNNQRRRPPPRRKRRKKRQKSQRHPKPNQLTHGPIATSSPLTWTRGSDSTPTTTRTSPSSTSGA